MGESDFSPEKGIYYKPDGSEGGPPGGEELEARFRLAQQETYARGSPELEVLRSAPAPELVISTVTELLEDFEDLEKQEAHDRYTLKPYYQTAGARARSFEKDKDTLLSEGIIKIAKDEGGNPITYKNQPVYITKVLGYSIENRQQKTTKSRRQVLEERVLNEAGEVKEVNWKERITGEEDVDEVPYYGTNKERERLARVYRRAEMMMVVRERLHNLYTYAYLPHTADLPGMVENFYLRYPGFTNKHLKELFNLPDFAEFEESPENNLLGQRIDLALRLFYTVSQSEMKSKMENLMKRPGWKFVKDKLLEFERESAETLGNEDFLRLPEEEQRKYAIEKWIGKVDKWEEDEKRGKDTTKEEVKGGRRGFLTMFGNLYAKGNTNEREKISSLIGILVGDPVATRIADRFFKISGLAAEEGIERYSQHPNGIPWKVVKDVAEGSATKETKDDAKDSFQLAGEPVTDDLAKIMNFRGYREKEMIKGRSGGPEETLEDFEKLTLSLFRFASSKTEYGWRSVLEQWWGYPEEGSMSTESAKRLGEIDWEVGPEMRELVKGVEIEDLIPQPLLKNLEKLDPESQEKKYLELMVGVIKPGQLKGLNIKEKESKIDIWKIYALMLYLAGRKEPMKGIYDFLYAEDFDPNSFLRKDFWKHKTKFLGIVRSAFIGSAGGSSYRELYTKAKAEAKEKGENLNQEELDDVVEEELEDKEEEGLSRDKKNFWKGVKTLPQWNLIWDMMELKTRPGLKLPSYLTAEADALAKRYGYLE